MIKQPKIKKVEAISRQNFLLQTEKLLQDFSKVAKPFIQKRYVIIHSWNYRSSYALLIVSFLIHGICGASVTIAGIHRFVLYGAKNPTLIPNKSCFYQVVSFFIIPVVLHLSECT